jgi:hypothetical protein
MNSYSPNGVVIAVFGCDGDLVESAHQINRREDGAACKVLRKVLNVRHGILVGYGAWVEGAVVAAGSPRGVFFGC